MTARYGKCWLKLCQWNKIRETKLMIVLIVGLSKYSAKLCTFAHSLSWPITWFTKLSSSCNVKTPWLLSTHSVMLGQMMLHSKRIYMDLRIKFWPADLGNGIAVGFLACHGDVLGTQFPTFCSDINRPQTYEMNYGGQWSCMYHSCWPLFYFICYWYFTPNPMWIGPFWITYLGEHPLGWGRDYVSIYRTFNSINYKV